MDSKKAKKTVASAAAAVLAAALVVGGTFSRWTSTSEVAVNSFTSNELDVEVGETTGDSYDIIPGSSEEKDPYVTVESTLDSVYVYLFVVDDTEGLVTYEIADGWTPLYGEDDEDPYEGTGITVYYRMAEAGTSSFQVLVDDTVYYSEDITNEDMQDEDGELLTDLTLSFYSIAVQAIDGDDAQSALESVIATADDEDSLAEAAENGGIIVLADDIEVTSAVEVAADTVIYGAGYTLSSDSSTVIYVDEDATLTVSGGTIESTATSGSCYAVDNEGGTVVLEDVTITNAYTYAIVNHGTMTLEDCTLVSDSTTSSAIENGWYTPSQNTSGEDCVLTINGGTYSCGYYVVKNDDYGIMTINDGTFTHTGSSGGTILNWNELTINGGTFVSEQKYVIYNSSASDNTSDAYATYESGTLVINGGSFTSEKSNQFLMQDYNYGSITITDGTFDAASGVLGYLGSDGATISLSGGTYSSYAYIYSAGESGYVDSTSSCIADGYELTENEDGTYSVTEAE